MKLLKSKKGLGEWIIADVFALLAYFIIFIIVLVLVAYSGQTSKASVMAGSAKLDYTVELVNALRTPVTLADGRNVTFAEYIAWEVDTPLCEGPLGWQTPVRSISDEFYNNIEPKIKHIPQIFKDRNAYLSLYISPARKDNCNAAKAQVGYDDYVKHYFETKDPGQSWPYTGIKVDFPTRNKKIVTIRVNANT